MKSSLNLKIQILPIGEIEQKTLKILENDLEKIFDTVVTLEPIGLIESAFDPERD